MRPIHSFSIDQFGTAMILFEPVTDGVSVRQVEIIPDSIIVDLAADGRIIGVEILDPVIVERLFSPPVAKLFKTYNIERAVT
jgi:uncharacterized protein YuzE